MCWAGLDADLWEVVWIGHLRGHEELEVLVVGPGNPERLHTLSYLRARPSFKACPKDGIFVRKYVGLWVNLASRSDLEGVAVSILQRSSTHFSSTQYSLLALSPAHVLAAQSQQELATLLEDLQVPGTSSNPSAWLLTLSQKERCHAYFLTHTYMYIYAHTYVYFYTYV